MRSTRLFLALSLLWLSGNIVAEKPSDQATAAQIRKLEAKIASVQKALAKDRRTQSQTLRELRSLEKQLGDTNRKIRLQKSALRELNTELKDLNRQQTQLQGQMRQQQQLIGEQIREAYKLGRQRKLKLLLNQEEPENLQRNLRYYDYVNKARSEAIAEFNTTIEKLEALKPAIAERKNRILETQAALEQEQAKLAKQRQAREQALTALKREISNKGQSLERFFAERKALQDLLDSLEQELAKLKLPSNYQDFSKRRGKLPWPVNGRQSNRYGGKKGSTGLHWTGVNLRAQSGTEVKAVHYGRVVFADWLRGTGLLIVLDHGDGYMSLYGHNQSLLHEVGDWVAPGDVIATVGNSGGQSQSALYFEIRRRGKPLDPNSWCRRG